MTNPLHTRIGNSPRKSPRKSPCESPRSLSPRSFYCSERTREEAKATLLRLLQGQLHWNIVFVEPEQTHICICDTTVIPVSEQFIQFSNEYQVGVRIDIPQLLLTLAEEDLM